MRDLQYEKISTIPYWQTPTKNRRKKHWCGASMTTSEFKLNYIKLIRVGSPRRFSVRGLEKFTRAP